MTTIDPRYLEAPHWAALTGQRLYQFGSIPALRSPDDWKTWGNYVASLPALAALSVPLPYGSDWRQWAVRFNQAAKLLNV